MGVWPTGIQRGGRSCIVHLYSSKEGKEKLMDYCSILACFLTSIIAALTSVSLYVLSPEKSFKDLFSI